MTRTRQGNRRVAAVLVVAVVVSVSCGSEGSESGARVLGAAVTNTSTTTAAVDVEISATSIVRDDPDADTDAAPATSPAAASARRPAGPSSPAPTIASSPAGRPDPGGPAGPAASESAAVVEARQAIVAGDLCEAYRALARFEVSGANAVEFRRDMLVVVDLMATARPLVPEALVTAWEDLRSGSQRVVDVLAHDGATVGEAAAVYRDERFRSAMERTDAWVAEHCDG